MTAVDAPASPAPPADLPPPAEVATRVRRPHRLRADLAAALAYLVGGYWMAHNLWTGPGRRVLASFPPDQYQFELWLNHAARIFTHGEHPLFTHQMNVPDGVNMMANTGTFGMTVPLVPVTLLFGAPVAFAVMVTVAPFLTALCWYLLFSRRIVGSRRAAAVAGAFCGFGPGIIAQDNIHPNVAMQAAVPLIVWQLLRMRDSGVPAWRPGLALGALVVYQFFVNEEILLFTALGCLVFVAAWAGFNRMRAWALRGRFLVALGVAATLAGALLAYPLWWQFAGPQHYRGFGAFTNYFGTDIASLTVFPTQSLADGVDSTRVANNVVEETTLFGIPLLVMAIAWIAMTWRRTVVRAAAIGAGIILVASFGGRWHVEGVMRDVPAPWSLVARAPLLDSVIAGRLALAIIPLLALPMALVLDRCLSPSRDPRPAFRAIALAGVAAALVPLVPTPFPAVDRDPVPAFVSSGQWHDYVPADRSMLLIPVPTGLFGIAAVQWSNATGGQIPLAGGYFVGPNPDSPDGEGMSGPPHRPTLDLLFNVVVTGRVPAVTAEDRRNAVADLRYWRASVVVLSPSQAQADHLDMTMTALLGFPPSLVGGVWLWDVRSLAS